MKDGSDEGVGDVVSGSLPSVGMGGKEIGDGIEKTVCKMGDGCVESSGLLIIRWLLPRLFIDERRDEI